MDVWKWTVVLSYIVTLAAGNNPLFGDEESRPQIEGIPGNVPNGAKDLSSYPGEGRGSKVQNLEEPYNGYDVFLVNEYSFKFWSVIQIIAALLLIYGAVLGIYHSKFTFSDEDFYAPFVVPIDKGEGERRYGRAVVIPSSTMRTIMDSIYSDKMKTSKASVLLFILMSAAVSSQQVEDASPATNHSPEGTEENRRNATALSTSVGEARGKVQSVDEPYYGYDAFLINEYSFKFWSVIQVVSALLLIYASVLGVYYSKFTFSDEDFYPPFFVDKKRSARSVLPPTTMRTIMESISSDKYS